MEQATTGLGDNEARNHGLVALVQATWQLHLGGNLWELRRAAQAGAVAFAATGDGRMQGFIELTLGYASLQLGDYEAAFAQLLQSIEHMERLRERLGAALARAHFALGLLDQGGQGRQVGQGGQGEQAGADHVAKARQQAAAILGQDLVGYWKGLAHAIMAKVLAVEGAWETAEQEIRRALATSAPAPTLLPMMFATLMEILLGQGQLMKAVGAAHEGLALLEQLGGSCWYDNRLYLTAAEVYLRAGQPEEARQAAMAAGRLLRRRAELIQDEAVRERYLTQVPYNARVLELLRSVE